MSLQRKIQNWLLLLVAGTLLGCASTPTPNPWDTVEVPREAIETPLPCDQLPSPGAPGMPGNDLWQGRVDAMRDCAMANYDIANAHVDQIEDLRDATQDLTEAGQHQRRISDMRLEMLEDERRHNFWSSIGYWIMIGVLGAAAL